MVLALWNVICYECYNMDNRLDLFCAFPGTQIHTGVGELPRQPQLLCGRLMETYVDGTYNL